MRTSLTRLDLLRATEAHCLLHGVDSLTLSVIARATDSSPAEITAFFHDEVALLDGVLERHQTAYESAWEPVFPSIDTPRAALRLLVSTIAAQIRDEDGGPAYVAIGAQMSTSARFALTGRPATTSAAALKLMGKLTATANVPFTLMPIRFERFAVVLFSSVFAWYQQGPSRLPEAVFVEDLVDCLAFISLGAPSPELATALEKSP